MFNKIARKKVTKCLTKQPERKWQNVSQISQKESDGMFNKIAIKKVAKCFTKQPERK